jgi:uncharacterized protein
MPNKHGDFIWYELMTGDLGASAAFYGAVLDWSFPPSKSEPDDYWEVQVGDVFVGGMLRLKPEMEAGGARPAWLGYIAVDDVDASVTSIEAAGGKTYLPGRDMPGVGRFAMVADPQGAPFYVMRPIPPAGDPDATSHAFASERPMMGHCAWNELMTSDKDAALTFYNRQFGWVKDGDMDMGPMGKYDFIRHGFAIGAMMNRPPEMPVSAWAYYFRVPDIDASVEMIKASGGQVINGPMEVPGGDWCLNGKERSSRWSEGNE